MVNIASHLLFKEKLRAKNVAALMLTLVGCFLAVGAYSPATIDLNLLGIVFGFGSGCCTAFYTIYSKFLLRDYSSHTISFWGFVFAAAALILINPIGLKQVVIASHYSKLLLIVLALIPTVLAYSALTTSIKIIGPSKTAIVKTLEPVIAAILSLVILGEKLTLLQWIGILLVIFGVGLIYSREKTI
jgi:DME family drug/metabolite transporter